MSLFTYRSLLLVLVAGLSLTGGRVYAQEVTIKGTVYNMYRTRPLDGVSVMATSGRGTTTDSSGNYEIRVRTDDSIFFSYLGRSTTKYPVSTINFQVNFDIALHVDPITLKEISVMPRNYRMDSLQNRRDYAKIFDYKKPGFHINGPSTQGLGVGVDLDQLIEMFQFNKIRREKAFQARLINEEQEKFIDHRFSPYVVGKVTHLKDLELDSFMVEFRPSYLFCEVASDYDFLDYIKLAFAEFRKEHPAKAGEMKQP